MSSRRGPLALLAALFLAFLATPVAALVPETPLGPGVSLAEVVRRGLLVAAVLSGVAGLYAVASHALVRDSAPRRRREALAGALRLVALLAGALAALAVATDQWLGALVSLGVVGIAISLAVQQPLLSLLGWVYIAVKGPYGTGDRIAIEGSKGDVLEIDYLTTTLREVNGDLVSTHQPSGRLVTVPNSAVLSSHVINYSDESFPHVWNELALQVAYETDLAFAADLARAEADDYLGDEMAAAVAQFRDLLTETEVEREVAERPTVNVRQAESWVELRVRYVVDPTRGQRVRNDLYERILARFNEHPERVKFPVGRNR